MKIVITSGYFNPLHGGHLDLIEGAAKLGDRLIVSVNNDKQQLLKKGKIILDEQNRMRLMRALKGVDEVVLTIDTENTFQTKTLDMLGEKYPNDELIFAKGGDRSSEHSMPEDELDVCKKHGIKIVFGVGSHEVEKRDSSTRINQANDKEQGFI